MQRLLLMCMPKYIGRNSIHFGRIQPERVGPSHGVVSGTSSLISIRTHSSLQLLQTEHQQQQQK